MENTKETTKADKYENDILTGKIQACNYVKLAMQRHRVDLLRNDIYFDPVPGQKAEKFFKMLRHYKGSYKGQKFELSPWQSWILSRLLGWKRKNGKRRFTELYLEVPRKNGKTSLLAGLALYLIFADGEAAPEIYTAATKEDQAKLLVDEAAKIAAESGLVSKKYLKIYKYNGITRFISYPRKNGIVKPLGRDSDTLDGLNVFAGMIDEYHAHKDNGIIDVLKSGAGARKQPLICVITTAGFDKTKPAFSHRKQIIKILAGMVEQDNLLGIIYTLDPEDNWKNPENWIKANPNFNISVQSEYLKDQGGEAITNPDKQVNFKTKHLNIWEDAQTVFIPFEIWQAGATPATPPEDLTKWPAFGGLDLASGFDFNAFVLEITSPDGLSFLKTWFWLPADRVAKHAENNPNIKKWIADAQIILQPGAVMDWQLMAADIYRIIGEYNLQGIAFDRYKADHGVIQHLQKLGLEPEKLDSFSQAITNMSEPTKEFQRLAYDKKLKHFGNPVLTWMLANVEIFTDTNGNIKPNRNDARKKIDGIIAAIMARGEAMTLANSNESNEINIRTL